MVPLMDGAYSIKEGLEVMKKFWLTHKCDVLSVALCVQLAVNAAVIFHLFSDSALSIPEKFLYILLLIGSFVFLHKAALTSNVAQQVV